MLLELQPVASTHTTPAQWAMVAVGILTILYVAVIRPLRKGKPRRDPLERKPSSLAQHRAVERDMESLLVQYEEMIRRMTAQVDTRATRLELLIRDADEKIALLKALIAANPANPASVDGKSIGNTPATTGAITAGGEAAPNAVRGELQLPAPTDDPAASDGRTPVDASARADKLEKVDDRHAEIYRLADTGLTARQIAQELSRVHGEVELILHLRNPRQEQGDLWAPPTAGSVPEPMPGQTEAFSPKEAPAAPGSGEPRRKGRKKQRSPGG